MKAEHHSAETLLAGQAMRRAARKVLSDAVRDNRPIPLWDGTKVVWKVPKEGSLNSSTPRHPPCRSHRATRLEDRKGRRTCVRSGCAPWPGPDGSDGTWHDRHRATDSQGSAGTPPSERAELVERLLRSLGSSTDAAWAREVEARFDAHDAGRIASSPATRAMGDFAPLAA